MKNQLRSIESKLRAANTELKYVMNDSKRKNIFKMGYEALKFGVAERTVPICYFTSFLYRKDCRNYSDYISYKTERTLIERLNDHRYIHILENKLTYDLYFSKHIEELPELLAYNMGNIFFVGGEKEIINDSKSFLKFLVNILEAYDSVFIKATDGIGGKDIYKIDKEKIETFTDEEISDIYETITKSSFLIQRTLKQNEEVSCINTSSINTIRFNTYLNDDNKVEIISAFMRFGRQGGFVDNGSSEGCFVSIDMVKGKLTKKGTSFLKFGGAEYYKHPDTGFIFENFSIPYFEQAVDLVKKAHGLIPPLKLVGWDVAISDRGPVLIEGNHNLHLRMADTAYGGYKKNPIFSKILKTYLKS